MKVEFLRGASHELKTPLTSLKILIENMQKNIGRYKDRDRYLAVASEIVDELSHNVFTNINPFFRSGATGRKRRDFFAGYNKRANTELQPTL